MKIGARCRYRMEYDYKYGRLLAVGDHEHAITNESGLVVWCSNVQIWDYEMNEYITVRSAGSSAPQ